MLLCVRDLPTRGTLHADRSVGVTPAAVAKASGLARSSVYQYFPTTGALLAVAIERLDSALTVAGDDVEARLTAYVATTLELAAQGHSPSRTLGMSGLPDECLARLRELHDTLAAPFVTIIEAYAARLPGADADVLAGLASGALNGAALLVEHGASLPEVTAETVRFITAGLR